MSELSATQQLVQAMYKDDQGNPILLSPGQDEIFANISMKLHNRVHIMPHTRFGKSFTVGLSVLTRAATFPEKWALIAPTKDKARIIMDYVIGHIFDNDFTASRFIPEKGENIEEIRRRRNKDRLTFKVGKDADGKSLLSEVFIGTAKEALGFGAPNVVVDEAALINDDDFSMVVRMLGDDPHNNFMAKIGNPFVRNHFLKSYHDPLYHKILVDCYRSLKEGRITQATIDENRPYIYFGVLYECKFPRASEVDESGWLYLLTDDDITNAISRNNQPVGKRRLGIDVARGGRNYNAWVLRTDNYAEVLRKDLDDDLISSGDTTINLMRENGISADDVFVDDSGVGGGLTDYLRSRGCKINAVNFGMSVEKDRDASGKILPSDYLNVRAYSYAGKEGVAAWIKQTGQLKPHKDWEELTVIRYKKDLNGKIKIEPKEEMRKRGVESPDIADALALTFAQPKRLVYHVNDPVAVLSAGAPTPFGGVSW